MRPAPRQPQLPTLESPRFEVPAVPARPLDIDAGDKLAVSRFELEGARDLPEFGVAIAELEQLVESKRAAYPAGFTVGHLQEVADAVTTYYRERGLILAQATVPVQTVTDDVVRIRILEGNLGRVLIEGNKRYGKKLLRRVFKDSRDRPIHKDEIESALLALNRAPGLTLFGIFQPGQQVGTADLAVKVQEEDRFAATVRADNHGIRETGKNRYRLEGVANNPTGAADRLTATAQVTQVPANSFYWGAEYERPLWFPSTLASVRFDRNRFDVGGAFRDRDIESDTQNLYTTVNHAFVRSRQRNLEGRVEFARKQAETNVRARGQSKDDLSVVLVGADFDLVDTRFAGLNAGVFEFSHGFNDFLGAMGQTPARVRPSRQGGDRTFAEGEFNKLFFSFSRLQSLTPLTNVLRHHSVLLRAEAQWTDDLLVPLEQYAIGGSTSVRAYQPTELLFDRAFFGSLEWIINAPGIADQPAFDNRTWGELLQVSFYFDYAAGKLNKPLASEDRSDNLKGAGMAISFNNPGKYSFKLSVANPIGDPESASGNRPQYWVDLNLFF